MAGADACPAPAASQHLPTSMLIYSIAALAIVTVTLLSYWLAAGASLPGQNARKAQRRPSRTQ